VTLILHHKKNEVTWDKADRMAYYLYTGQHLQPLVDVVRDMSYAYQPQAGIASVDSVQVCIETVYNSIVSVLCSAAGRFVPKCQKGLFRFWWDEELKLLKQKSIESNEIWKAAGRPRDGPIFNKRQSCRLLYRKRIRENQRSNTETYYTNDLHEALLTKNNKAFWKSWRSKFNLNTKCSQVDGCVDKNIIANKFASHFMSAFTCNIPQKAESLKEQYAALRAGYHKFPVTEDQQIDTELVSSIIDKLTHGKAADFNGLSSEHLYYCHPSLSVILAKLFQIIMRCSYVPVAFKYSYIVPIPNVEFLADR